MNYNAENKEFQLINAEGTREIGNHYRLNSNCGVQASAVEAKIGRLEWERKTICRVSTCLPQDNSQ